MVMWVAFPFLLQWSLGGFANASAVAMWAMGAPLMANIVGAYLWPWLAAFAGLSVFSGLIDSSLAANAPELPEGVITAFFVLNFLGIAFVTFVSLRFFIGERERARIALDEQNRLLEVEQEKSERLLLNVLPAAIAERLKRGEEPIADRIPEVTVVVADIVGFTPMSQQVAPTDVVHLLNELFSKFDDLTDELGLEKLKTIGDAYQAMGGLPGTDPDHTAAIADLALAMGAEADLYTVPGFGRAFSCGSGSTSDRLWLGSSASESSATRSGETRSTPPAEWSRTAFPDISRSPNTSTRRCATATCSNPAASSP